MSKELKTGVIAVLIIALAIWGYNFLKRQDLFSSGVRYFNVEYNNINGLNEASLVSINGLQVGKIEKIVFNTNPEKKGTLLVSFSVKKDFNFSKNSIAKIYPAGIMGGQNLAIVPSYIGEQAETGDYLTGAIEPGMMDAFSDKLNPIQNELKNVLVGADSLLIGVNQVLDLESRQSLNRSILGLEKTILDVRRTLSSVNGILDENKVALTATVSNAKKITDDFSKVSGELANVDISGMIKKVESTLDNVNTITLSIKNGNGTLGKLMTDEKMYTNLTNATKELEELLRELKLNPKRFVHFSLFGKKAKPYDEENNNENISNQ